MLRININLGGRSFGMWVETEEEEERIRKAAKLVNDKIDEFKSEYSVGDINMLFAMTALSFASEALDHQKTLVNDDHEVIDKLNDLDQLLDETPE